MGKRNTMKAYLALRHIGKIIYVIRFKKYNTRYPICELDYMKFISGVNKKKSGNSRFPLRPCIRHPHRGDMVGLDRWGARLPFADKGFPFPGWKDFRPNPDPPTSVSPSKRHFYGIRRRHSSSNEAEVLPGWLSRPGR